MKRSVMCDVEIVMKPFDEFEIVEIVMEPLCDPNRYGALSVCLTKRSITLSITWRHSTVSDGDYLPRATEEDHDAAATHHL